MEKLTVEWNITPIKWRSGCIIGSLTGWILVFHNTSHRRSEIYRKFNDNSQIYLENVGSNEIVLYTLDQTNNWARRVEGNEVFISGDVDFMYDGDSFKTVGTTIDASRVVNDYLNDGFYEDDQHEDNHVDNAQFDGELYDDEGVQSKYDQYDDEPYEDELYEDDTINQLL